MHKGKLALAGSLDKYTLFRFQATASPEPVYDISECGLKNVPSGVYSSCMIQRKEALLLQVICMLITHLHI